MPLLQTLISHLNSIKMGSTTSTIQDWVVFSTQYQRIGERVVAALGRFEVYEKISGDRKQVFVKEISCSRFASYSFQELLTRFNARHKNILPVYGIYTKEQVYCRLEEFYNQNKHNSGKSVYIAMDPIARTLREEIIKRSGLRQLFKESVLWVIAEALIESLGTL